MHAQLAHNRPDRLARSLHTRDVGTERVARFLKDNGAMKPARKRTLKLNRTTIRILGNGQLTSAVGGWPESYHICSSIIVTSELETDCDCNTCPCNLD